MIRLLALAISAVLAALVVGGLVAALQVGPEPFTTAPGLLGGFLPPESVTVLDGDTIRLPGIPTAVRLVGFNAPEIKRRACARAADT